MSIPLSSSLGHGSCCHPEEHKIAKRRGEIAGSQRHRSHRDKLCEGDWHLPALVALLLKNAYKLKIPSNPAGGQNPALPIIRNIP